MFGTLIMENVLELIMATLVLFGPSMSTVSKTIYCMESSRHAIVVQSSKCSTVFASNQQFKLAHESAEWDNACGNESQNIKHFDHHQPTALS